MSQQLRRRRDGASAVSILFGLLLAAAAGAAEPPAAATDAQAVEMRVNGAAISRMQVELLMNGMLASNGDEATPTIGEAERRQAALRDLATQEVLAQAAATENLDKDPEVADALAHARREIMARVYLQHYFYENPVSPEELRAGYDYNRSNGKILEYRVHQILVPTRKEAEEILERKRKGESLASLVKLSRDPGGNTNEGLVTPSGWFRPDLFVDLYFSEAVQALKPGTASTQPVRSRFGWHILWLDEPPRPVVKPEPYDQLDPAAQEALRQRETQRRMNAVTTTLLARAKLTDPAGKAVAASSFATLP